MKNDDVTVIKLDDVAKTPPEGSDAPLNCEPSYIDSKDEAPEGARVYEGPDEGLFYCQNFEEIEDFEGELEDTEITTRVDNLSSFASVSEINIADPATDDIVSSGDIVLFEDDDGEYKVAEVAKYDQDDKDAEMIQLSPADQAGTQSVPEASVHYSVDNSSDRDMVEFRFGEGVVPTQEGISSEFGIEDKDVISANPDSTEVGESVVMDLPGVGIAVGEVVEADDEIAIMSSDSKIKDSETGAELRLTPEEAFQDGRIAATVDNMDAESLVQMQLSSMVDNTSSEQINFNEAEVGNVVRASVKGVGTVVGEIYNTGYRDDDGSGSVGMRYYDGSGGDRHAWFTEDDLINMEKVQGTSTQFGVQYSTLTFSNNVELDREQDAGDGDVILADAGGIRVAGVLEEDRLHVDQSKYPNLEFRQEDGKKAWYLRVAEDEYIQFDDGPGSKISTEMENVSAVGVLQNTEEGDVISTQPDEWEMPEDSTIYEAAQDYIETVDTNASDDSWYKFIQEMMEEGEDHEEITNAVLLEMTFQGELGKESYQRDFYRNNSTVERRKEKMRNLEHSASRAFAEMSKVETDLLDNPVSLGFYDRTLVGDDNYDQVREGFRNFLDQQDVDPEEYEKIVNSDLLSKWVGGNRTPDVAPIYFAAIEELDLDEDANPQYFNDQKEEIEEMREDPSEDVHEHSTIQAIAAYEDIDPEDVNIDEYDVGEGSTMFQFRDEEIASELVDSFEEKKDAFRYAINFTQQVMDEMGLDEIPVYRAIASDQVVDDAIDSVEQDKPFHVKENSVASFTTSPLKALYFGNNKAGPKGPAERDDYVVYRDAVNSEEIVAFSELLPGLNSRGQSEVLVGQFESTVDSEDVMAARQIDEDADSFFNVPDDAQEHEKMVRSVVKEIGPRSLQAIHESDKDLQQSSVKELMEVQGIGIGIALNAKKALGDYTEDPREIQGITSSDIERLVDNDLSDVEDYREAGIKEIEGILDRPGVASTDASSRAQEIADYYLIGAGEPRDVMTDEENQELRDELEEDGLPDFLLELFDETTVLGEEFFRKLTGVANEEDILDADLFGGAYDPDDFCPEVRDLLETWTNRRDPAYIESNVNRIEEQREHLTRDPEERQLAEGWEEQHKRPPKHRTSIGRTWTVPDMVGWSREKLQGEAMDEKQDQDVEVDYRVQESWIHGTNDEIENGNVDPSGKDNLISSHTFDEVVKDDREAKFAGVESITDEKRQLRKWRIYVDYAHDIPDWADREEGPRGGIYYEVEDQDLINELLSPPRHEVENPEEFPETQEDTGPRQTVLPTDDTEPGQTAVDQYSIPKTGEHIIERQEDEREYWRVYVDSEEEAPDWATVSGPSPEGNLYYIVFDEDLFAELIEEPQHEVDDYDLEGYLSNYQDESVEIDKDDIILKRRFQIYVDSEDDVPDWARSYVGDQGGIFYVVYNKRLFDELMSSPKHEIPDDFNLQNYMYGGPGRDEDEEDGDGEEKSLTFVDLEKRRIYIESPTEAPDGKEVHQGDKGGYYYVAGSGEDSSEETTSHSGFEQKLRNSLEEGELIEITCAEFAGNIDKIQDGDLLEDVYREESREVIRREIEQWAGQLSKHFEFDYKQAGPKKTNDISEYGQVISLTDISVDEDELEGDEKKLVEEWQDLKNEADEIGKVEVDKRREFRKMAENVKNDAILQYLWEKGLGEFEDLNTHIEDILHRRGYSPRTEMIPGILRRLDLKYDYSLQDPEGKVADAVETGDILRRTEQQKVREHIEEIENADMLNDIKFAAMERGVSDDSTVIRAINDRIAELNCRSVESFNIRYGVYQDIISRPAGLTGEGQGIHKDAWDNIWENSSTSDLKEFAEAAESRNNDAHASIIRGMLCYRKDIDVNARDIVNLDYVNGEMDEEKLYTELERVLAKLDPVVGACLLSRLATVRSEKLESNKESFVLFRGMFGIDGSTAEDSYITREVFCHLVAHILHDMMGLDVKQPGADNDDEDMGEGWEYTVIQPKNKDNDYLQEFYEKMRKEWKRYTSKDAEECRIYQRVAPSEFMACTFALWLTDPNKLNIIHPEMDSLYDDFFGSE